MSQQNFVHKTSRQVFLLSCRSPKFLVQKFAFLLLKVLDIADELMFQGGWVVSTESNSNDDVMTK